MNEQRRQKEAAIAKLGEKIARARAGIIADYQGLTVAEVTEIRRAFGAAKGEYNVVKNTLMKRALQGTKHEKLSKLFKGTTAVVFSDVDEYGLLGKAAKELVKKFEKLKVRAAFIQEEVLTGDAAVETMASMPTLDEARAQLLGVINAPAAKLLAQINAPASNLIGVIQAKSDKDKEATPA